MRRKKKTMAAYKGTLRLTCVGILFLNLAVEAASVGEPNGEFIIAYAFIRWDIGCGLWKIYGYWSPAKRMCRLQSADVR
jgi:hypothetical protein